MRLSERASYILYPVEAAKGIIAPLHSIIYSLFVLSNPVTAAYTHSYTHDCIIRIRPIAHAPSVSPPAFGTLSTTVPAVGVEYSVGSAEVYDGIRTTSNL